jgi:hypothetical protein
MVVGSRYFRFEIFLERVLGTVLRDDRDASLHLHVSRVVGYDPSGFEFYLFLFGFLFERFVAHSDGASPAYAGVVYSLFILDCMVMYLYLSLFCLFCDCFILFI